MLITIRAHALCDLFNRLLLGCDLLLQFGVELLSSLNILSKSTEYQTRIQRDG